MSMSISMSMSMSMCMSRRLYSTLETFEVTYADTQMTETTASHFEVVVTGQNKWPKGSPRSSSGVADPQPH